MPLRRETRRRAEMLAVLLVTASIALTAQRSGGPAASDRLDDGEIAQAMEVVKADPNLATHRTIKLLRLKDGAVKPTSRPAWLDWLAGFVRWMDQSARALFWVGLAVLAAFLVAYIIRTLNSWAAPDVVGDIDAAPTHVQDLDIRPETLPENVGAAARHLWDRGDHRAALALLYRGLLSRLAHAYRLPIRDSSTEGDCLALAGQLGERGGGYATRLIPIWQAAVYGHTAAPTTVVYGLCDDFGPALDPVPAEDRP